MRFLVLLLLLPFFASCNLILPEPDPIQTVVHRTAQAGDVLRVRDMRAPRQPAQIMRVDAYGDVNMGDMGSMPVVGYTAEDVATVLTSFSEDPGVRLSVEILPPSKRYWLYGEVARGGRQSLRPGMTLGEAVAMARPHPTFADLARVRWVRGVSGEEMVVDVTSASLQILEDGDMLLVPPVGARDTAQVGLAGQ